MNAGMIILCRSNSSRLSGKALRNICGKPALQYIVERLGKVVDHQRIVVATSTEPADDLLDEYCKQHNIACFRGSLENVAQRFLDCARSFGFEYAVRVNGDNVLTDAFTLQKMLNVADTHDLDLVSNVKNRTFPRGMSIEIVRTAFYEQASRLFSAPRHFEHVTSYFYEHEVLGKRYNWENRDCPEAAGLQLALDTAEDLRRLEIIIGAMTRDHTSYGLRDIYEIIVERQVFETARMSQSKPLIEGASHV